MFQFPASAPYYCMATGLQPVGLPHSDTCGSIRVCRSPQIFAAYRVLLRFRKPRHPPFALLLFLSSESNSILLVCLEIVVPNRNSKKLEFTLTDLISCFFFFTSILLSQYCQGSNAPSQWRLLCITKRQFDKYKTLNVPCSTRPRACVKDLAPKRRCSSHTFRYGYLVTT